MARSKSLYSLGFYAVLRGRRRPLSLSGFPVSSVTAKTGEKEQHDDVLVAAAGPPDSRVSRGGFLRRARTKAVPTVARQTERRRREQRPRPTDFRRGGRSGVRKRGGEAVDGSGKEASKRHLAGEAGTAD